MEVAHIDAFHDDPERFWGFYAERFAALEDKQPNDVHRALVTLEAEGLLDAVITQNVDMLHRRAGTRELVEVHGSIAHCICLECGVRVPLAEARRRSAADERGVPRCERCRVPLKPDVVLFGEMLPAAAIERAQELCVSADLLLCIGSSLEVHPVAELPLLTRRAGGEIAILTRGDTPLDALASVRLDGDLVVEMRGAPGRRRSFRDAVSASGALRGAEPVQRKTGPVRSPRSSASICAICCGAVGAEVEDVEVLADARGT